MGWLSSLGAEWLVGGCWMLVSSVVGIAAPVLDVAVHEKMGQLWTPLAVDDLMQLAVLGVHTFCSGTTPAY